MTMLAERQTTNTRGYEELVNPSAYTVCGICHNRIPQFQRNVTAPEIGDMEQENYHIDCFLLAIQVE